MHKRNLADQAWVPKGMVWGKRNQGSKQGCTSKGKKVGHGENVVDLVVAISHGHGVKGCEQYKNMNGTCIVVCLKKIPGIFSKTNKGQILLQDGNPNQNSAAVRKGMHACNAVCLNIPNRRPDLNPIANLFHLVNKQISKDAKKQKNEH